MANNQDVLEFRKMNADVGIEMTLREAQVNYAASMTAYLIVTENGATIDEAIDKVQQFAHPEFHPAVCRKFLVEALAMDNE